MASNFRGDNSLNARDLFIYRQLYKGYALNPDSKIPVIKETGIRDFNQYSNIFYGKYPFGSSYVLKPKKELLVLRDDFYMFDFVAMALDDMLANYSAARTYQKIKRDEPYLSNPTLAGGYVDLDSLYTRNIGRFLYSFGKYINLRKLENKITSFEDYVHEFKKFVLPSMPRAPLTRSQFVLSLSTPALCTGLSVMLTTKNASVDQPKIDEFYKSPNFEFFRSSAIAYGFLIDKNVPWILTADLGSPQMKKYLDKSVAGRYLLNGTFSTAYEEISVSDIDFLKNEIINFYADFVTKNPYYRITEMGAYGEESCTKLVLRDSSAASAGNVRRLREKYNDDYWLPFYGEIRFAESGLEVDEATKNFVINNALQINKQKGAQEASRYIQRKTFNIIAVEGSLMYESKKRRLKNLTDASNSDILDEVRREVINDKFELF